MPKPLVFSLIIAIGVIAGAWARAMLTSEPTRVEMALNLFVEYCLSLDSRDDFQSDERLVRLRAMPGDEIYGHRPSLLTLNLGDRSCSVSDKLAPFKEDEHQRLLAEVTALVDEKFPELEEDRNTGLDGPKNGFWFQFPAHDPRRWGISIISFAGEPTSTLLSYYYRK